MKRLSRNDLYEYQKHAIRWLDSRPKAFLALEQGLGKTAVSIFDMELPAVIVCPATLRLNWLREILMWHGGLKNEHIDLISSGDERIVGAWVTIISYNLLTKRVDEIIRECDPRTAILDESHYLKTSTTKRTKAAKKLIKATPRVRLLSGTPILNRPIEIYPMIKAIGAMKMDWRNFSFRYCAAWNSPWGFDNRGASNLEELYQKLAPVMLRLTKQQCLPELPPKIYRVIEFDNNPSERELDLKQQLVELPEWDIDFQAISDISYLNALRKIPFSVKYIKDLLESQDKIVVFSWHKDVAEKLAEGLKRYNPVTYTGKTSHASRDIAVNKFQNDDTCRVIIGNIESMGTGLTLTAASHVVFVEIPWVPALLEQAADRCHRIGQRDCVTVDLLVYKKSIDSLRVHRILEKIKVITQVIK